MRKVLLSLLLLALGASAMAQQRIQLRSADKAECVKSDMTSLKASFSFSTIEAQDYESERGTFSWLSLANTVLGGNAGDPQIPVVNQLIAVPFGAQPRIEITSYSTTDYRLADYNLHTLVPRQLPVRKSQDPDEVPFVMNEAAYQTSGLRTEPQATVSVEGIMRGVQLGTMTIEPVSYDPVSNTIRVFNDIEVTVSFDGADAQATEDMLLRTYSPAFDAVYAQLFNNRAITDVYDQHPDLYNTPVKMLVICYSGFQGNAALNSWLQWKLQKGYYVDIFYTSETGTSASSIASFIKTKYNASVSAGNAYTYLIVIGDTGQVPQYMNKNIDSSIGNCASDLGYASVNFSSSTSNYFPDMYYSRISVENTTHLTNYMNKVLTYEKYEFTDGGNYLNNVILVGGWDSNWTSRVAKPTINYATNNYFKSSNTTYGGFENGTINATISTSSTQGYSGTNNGCYNGINNGVCFLNYTAHGDKQEWYQPKMTAAHVATLTNTGKYFFGVGNCCLTGNFNNTTTTYSPGSAIGTNACFAETMIRVPNAGAIAYVGCSPYSYWYEDFYWAVGAHSYSAGNAPSVSNSSLGVYDVMFHDEYWNSASALLYLGNLAVQQAVTNGNTNSSVTDGNCNNSAHYYFQFYHCFGDGSVMPYVTKPEENTVTIPSTVTPGTTSITVNALAGSYVAVTDNSSVIYGVAEANSSGVATVTFTNAIPSSGTLYVAVTRQQYQPWFGTITVQGGTQYTITANASPTAGGNVTGGGTYYSGTSCTLTATPNTGYTFTNWKKGSQVVSTDPTYTFTVTASATYTATFTAIPQYTISVSANPTAGGTVSGGGTFYENTQCTLTATANTHYEFVNWTRNGAQVSTSPTYTFTVTSAGAYTANFNAMQQHTVTCAAVQNGTISATPAMAYRDETVTLSATPATGYYFGGWTVTDASSNTIPVTDNQFTMPDSDVTVSASFVQGYNVTVADATNGSVSATPTSCVPGTTVTLTATPDAGYVLDSWMVFKTGDVNTAVSVSGNSFAMPSHDVTVVGIFSAPQGVDVTIGSGTSNNINLPTNTNQNYSVSQQIFTASEVGEAGTITKVAFRVSNSKSTTRTLEIYLSHTTKSSFSSTSNWVSQSSTYKVFSGSVTFEASGWTTITLDTPFDYNGASNLLLTVDDNTNSALSNSNRLYFYHYTTTSYTSLYKAGGTNYSPANTSGLGSGTRSKYSNQVIFTKAAGGTTESLSVAPVALGDFSYAQGEGPSAAKAVTLVACAAEDITVTAPEHFEVSDAADGTYGATLSIPVSSRGGRATLTYDFENGWQNWTTFQGSTTSPHSWMHNTEYPTANNDFSSGYGYGSSDGFMLSESYISGSTSGSGTAVTPDNYLVSPQVTLGGSITFQAGVQNVSYCAEKFSVMVSTTGNTSASDFTTVQTWTYSPNASSGSEWQEFTVDLSAYSGTGYIAIRHFDCYDQWILKVDDVTIVEGEETPVNPTNPTNGELVTANVYVRLKGGLSQGSYANETLTVATGDLSGSVSLSGEVTQGSAVTQTVNFVQGWNWWSAQVVADDLLAQIEQALGAKGVKIMAKDGKYRSYSSALGIWAGSLSEIVVGQMYKIQTNETCEISLTGAAVNPAEHPITIKPGFNWIGFTPNVSLGVNEAMSGYTPANGDVIKPKSGTYATYNSTLGMWIGNMTLEPGKGYMYESKATGNNTFYFPSAQ